MSRKNRSRARVIRGAFLLAPLALGVSSALAAPVPGGTLDPLSIPKYVTPLVIPPVLFDDAAAPMTVSVALRQFQQQVLPTGFPATTLWGYCDASQPGTTTCNNPAYTFEVTRNTTTTVTWVNDLVDVNGNFLTHIIRDNDGDPATVDDPIIDQTLHWANPPQECVSGIPRTDCHGISGDPYVGPIPMVTHVHGAHVGPISDGYPEAWWLPAASNIPAGYATQGTSTTISTAVRRTQAPRCTSTPTTSPRPPSGFTTTAWVSRVSTSMPPARASG